MVDAHGFVSDQFSDGVISDGHMSQAFGRGRLGPAYTGIIVIEDFDRGWGWEEGRGSVGVFDDVL